MSEVLYTSDYAKEFKKGGVVLGATCVRRRDFLASMFDDIPYVMMPPVFEKDKEGSNAFYLHCWYNAKVIVHVITPESNVLDGDLVRDDANSTSVKSMVVCFDGVGDDPIFAMLRARLERRGVRICDGLDELRDVVRERCGM